MKSLFSLSMLGLLYFLLLSSNSCEKIEIADEGGYEIHKFGKLVAMTTNSGCNLWDVSDPKNTKLKYRIQIGYSNGVRITGNVLFLSTQSDLYAYDISNASSPKQIGSLKCNIGSIFIKGNRVFVKDNRSITIINCEDPANMTKLDEYTFPTVGNGWGIYADDNYIYTANNDLWQLKYDADGQLSEPKTVNSPVAWGLTCDGSYIYTTTYNSGIKIIDIRDPNDIKQEGALNCGATWGITYSDGFVYVIDQHVGPRKIDISDINAPKQISKISDSYAGHDMIHEDGYIYCAGMGKGFYILDANDFSVVFD